MLSTKDFLRQGTEFQESMGPTHYVVRALMEFLGGSHGQPPLPRSLATRRRGQSFSSHDLRSSLASYVVSRSNVCIKSACILEIIVKYQFTMVRYGTCCALINETLRHPQKLSFLCLLPPPPIYFVWLATPSILARTSS